MTTAENPLKITVAGAGIGGLAAAIALARDGHAVRVAERAPTIAEVGAGIQVSPNGMSVLRAIGLEDRFNAISTQSEAVQLLDGPSGRQVATLDLAEHAGDLRWQLVHRAEFIQLLESAAKDAGVTIETGAEIAPPPAGEALEGDDLLVGADGLKSRHRASVDEASKPFFTGQVAWRAVIPEANIRPVVEVHMGPGRHLVTYPLPGDRRNIVAIEERDGWAEEGWSHEDHPANLRGAFTSFTPRVQGWLEQVEAVHLWGLFRHVVADRWWFNQQVLLGDAAHPTLPFLAQGANLALEDAYVLARSLGSGALDQGLAAYQMARQPRAAAVVDAASRNARNYHLSFPPARFLAHSALRIVGAISPGYMIRRFDWLYRYDVTADGD
ncbi:MAG: monooxygenase [Silicimonas sp.]|nr:monooxygenase [Silicimonas sp.]